MSTSASDDDKSGAQSDDTHSSLAPMDFSTFIMSLASSAMVNLGDIPPPGQDTIYKDIPAAKQIIDILGILEEKTRGNLSESETKLLTSLLYDLRVRYIDAQNES